MPKPSRYGYVLRRLLAGKTSAIDWKMAKDLAREGFVVVDESKSSHNTKAVTLTERGRIVAEAIKK